MALQSEVGRVRAQAPHFDSPILGGRSKSIRVFGIKYDFHDIVRMSFENLMLLIIEYLYAFPIFLPVPQLNGHVVTATQDQWLRWMHCNGANIV